MLNASKTMPTEFAAIHIACSHLWQIIIIIRNKKENVTRTHAHTHTDNTCTANADLSSYFESKTNFLMAFEEFVCLFV